MTAGLAAPTAAGGVSRISGDAAVVMKMTVGQLKEELKSRGLKASGAKAELQQRLLQAQE